MTLQQIDNGFTDKWKPLQNIYSIVQKTNTAHTKSIWINYTWIHAGNLKKNRKPSTKSP